MHADFLMGKIAQQKILTVLRKVAEKKKHIKLKMTKGQGIIISAE